LERILSKEDLEKLVQSLPDNAEIEVKLQWIVRSSGGAIVDRGKLILKKVNFSW
jgi:hypothetical protein